MEKANYGDVGKINKIMRNEANEDIIIWGASTAESHLIPDSIEKALGKSTFNYGLTGTSIDQSGGLLEYFFSINKQEQDIIISLDIHGSLKKRENYFRIFNWLHVLDNEKIYKSFYDIDTTLALKLKYLPFYKLLHYGKHNVKYLKTKKVSYDFPNDGFFARNGLFMPKKRRKFKFGESDFVFNNLKRVCELGIKNKKKIYVILTPMYYKGLEAGLNIESVVSKFKSLEEIGVKFINYIDHPLNKEKKYFRDNTHLNEKGALLFTRIFIEDFKSFK